MSGELHATPNITIDERRLPLVTLTYHRRFSDEDLERHLAELLALIEREPVLALIANIDPAPPPTAKQRARIGRFLKEHEVMVGKTVVVWTQVSGSAVLRGIVTAITWVSPPPVPAKMFATVEEAEAHCRGVLRDCNAAWA